MTMIERYKRFELSIAGTAEGNPYKDIALTADFSNGMRRMTVRGFYKGEGYYAVRFMPQEEGDWNYIVHSNDPQMDGLTGGFRCVPAREGNHGRVCLRTDVLPIKRGSCDEVEDQYHFVYEDGTRFQPFGTTCYAWINQAEEVQEMTLRTLAQAPFNKLRMCIFPKFYSYNTEDPVDYIFPGNAQDGFDYDRFNNVFLERLERRIAQLDDLGIEVDIILLHPYDRWGFSRMSREQDMFYLGYIVDRLSSYKNVWWSLANEYDLMPWKSIRDWDTYAHVIIEHDPYGHLRSIHNCGVMFDYTRPWITHVSVQRIDVYKTAENVTDWRQQYRKPVIVDEVGYEGDMDYGWGNLTGEEETRRFWEGIIRGGYMTHGESYVEKGPQIWWSHGGRLYGDSVPRLRFLRNIMAEIPEQAEPIRITPENVEANWDAPGLHDGESFYLYYYGFTRPRYRNYTLPEGRRYRLELIDTWNMTITELPDIYEGQIRITMGARQYMAVCMTEVHQ